MPLTKRETAQSGSPQTSMSGSRVSSSREHHADLLACEVGAQAEVGPGGAESQVRVRRPADVEAVGVVEHPLVAVGRAVEQQHLVPLVQLLPDEDGVRGDGPPHPVHRARPADDLVHPGGGHAGRVGLPDGPLVGVLAQRQEPVGERVPGGLVARRQQEDEERRQLGLGEGLAVDVGGDQCRRQVVGRVLQAEGGELGHERRQLLAGLEHGHEVVAARREVLGVVGGGDHVRAPEDGGVLGGRQRPSCRR